MNSVEMEFQMENNKKILELIIDIDDGNISKDILKYVTPHLRFNGKVIS